MDMLTFLVLAAVFLFVLSLFSVLYLAWSESHYVQKRNLRRRLLNISAGSGQGKEKLSLYKKQALEDADFFERLAYSLPRVAILDRKLVKVRFPLNATTFLLVSAALGGIGLLLGFRFMPTRIGAIVPALILLFLPYLLLCRAEKNYLAQFETQLPETLDFLARALRSGHAISAGFELVGTEMPEPTRSEFAAVVDEINLGLSFR
ncbi:MAG: hypothetical protein GX751_03385, partial [Desulfuromonadaceae bacterium]|nr:hypothetical protein [Desulfuromonadaceae bacterium]